MTSKVVKYSESKIKCSFFTKSAKLRVNKLPLKIRNKMHLRTSIKKKDLTPFLSYHWFGSNWVLGMEQVTKSILRNPIPPSKNTNIDGYWTRHLFFDMKNLLRSNWNKIVHEFERISRYKLLKATFQSLWKGWYQVISFCLKLLKSKT